MQQTYLLGRKRERDFQFYPTYVSGQCWPQPHWCVTESSAQRAEITSRCIRCGQTMTFHPKPQ